MRHAWPFASGAIAAVLNIALTSRLSTRHAAGFFNLLMAATAAFYFGSALSVGDTKILVLETSVTVLFFSLALVGQWHSLKFTAIAFLLHGVWDLLHVVCGWGANAGENFPVLCVAYDWVIAVYLWRLASAAKEG